MLQALKSVASLLCGVALLLLGNGLFATLIAVRLTAEGFSAEALGLVVSLYFLGLMAGSLIAARIVAMVGHIRAFAAFAGIMAAATLAMALVVDVAVWGVLRAVIGFCVAGLYMTTESWLNERATNRTRGQIFAIYMITSYAALGFGQLLLNVAPPEAPDLFLLIAMLVALCLVPVALTRAISPAPIEVTRFGLRRLYRVSPLGVVGCLASGAITATVYGLAPRFAQEIGFGVSEVSVFMAAMIFGGLILQWPVGRLSDRFDRRTVMAGVAFGAALCALALALVPAAATGALMLFAVLFGGLSFTLYPLSVAHANDYLEPTDLVAASGGLLLAYSLGAALGPLAASLFIGLGGPGALFVEIAVLAGLFGLFAIYRMTRREAVPPEDQIPFMPLTRNSPLAAELDPRAETDGSEG